MSFLEIKISCPSGLSEILIAELSSSGYNSFLETDEGLNAYIEEDIFSEELLKEIIRKYRGKIKYEKIFLENKNWNEEWEKNFEPVVVAGKCRIRASFHPSDPSYTYDIVINPKMSFGTGHHETTSLMIENQLEIDHAGKKVLDAGGGTGILAVMASKLGASDVLAYDIEDWAFENMKENCNLNLCRNIKTAQGTIKDLKLLPETYDIILANINRNVLLEEIPSYSQVLKQDGFLVLSGFYEEDISELENVARHSSLKFLGVKTKNRWASLAFQKN
jgi:ribosomal protein L11 methyltransferase